MSTIAPFRVAVIQEAPVFLDREATIDKACRLIGEAAAAPRRRGVSQRAAPRKARVRRTG